jgi:hypothetical protein
MSREVWTADRFLQKLGGHPLTSHHQAIKLATMKLAWWWEIPTDDEFERTELEVPDRAYAVGLMATELCESCRYEADFIGKVLTGLATRNYASVKENEQVTFKAQLT